MAKRDLTHAKDDRSEAEFETCMFKSDMKEGIWSDILRDEIHFRNKKQVIVENYGCGHDGKIIMNAEDVNSKPDKKFIIDGKEVLIEIKAYNKSNGDPRDMFTIKIHSLKECVKCKGFIVLPSVNIWAILIPEGSAYLLDKIKPKIYNGFSPNDLAIRCHATEIDLLLASDKIKMYNWSLESKNKIEKNWNKLFIKEKKSQLPLPEGRGL